MPPSRSLHEYPVQHGVKRLHDRPLHPPTTHAPPEQISPPPHRTLHPPQWAVDARLASQPSAVLPLQSPKPALQASVQPDPTHTPMALVEPTQVVVVLAVPPALQMLSIVDERQVAVPGEHTVVVEHAPAAQLWPAGHAVGVYPRPSALHTCRVMGPAHENSPGVQNHARHAPARQVVRAPQAVIVNAVPSALQVRTPEPTQSDAPGVHTRVVHTPPEQVVPAAHGVVV